MRLMLRMCWDLYDLWSLMIERFVFIFIFVKCWFLVYERM